MLDARHDFLADIAPLGEIDAAELVHVGLMRVGITINKVEAAARNPERNATCFIDFCVHQRGTEISGGFGGQMRRYEHAQSQSRQARIAIDQAILGRSFTLPDGQYPNLSENFDETLRAVVKLSLSTSSGARARGQSRKKLPPSAAGALATMQSAMILPCGVSKAAKRGVSGVTLLISAVSSPLRKSPAASPSTFTTPRSGRRAACISKSLPDVAAKRKALPASAQGRRLQDHARTGHGADFDLILRVDCRQSGRQSRRVAFGRAHRSARRPAASAGKTIDAVAAHPAGA